jgi:acyl-CoA thioester hydrolase
MSLTQHEIELRVRYCETDAMGFVHHSNYFSYFEMGRTELLRAGGGDYRAVEERGLFFVVAKISCSFKSPARYDDLLTLRTTLTKAGPVKLEHTYELFRDGQLLATGQSVLACIDREGRIQRIPE